MSSASLNIIILARSPFHALSIFIVEEILYEGPPRNQVPKCTFNALLLLLIALSIIVPDSGPVSYTHLRAHETDSYLVCRLLLE